jgi:hypothetical protein
MESIKLNKKMLAYVVQIMLIFSLTGVIMASAGVGSIRIHPYWPTPTGNPATFTTWVQGKDDACQPRVLVVMTDECKTGLNGGDITITWWDASVHTLSIFEDEDVNKDKIPDWAKGYTVASLKDHLDTSGTIWWAATGVLAGPLEVGTDYEFEVAIPSSEIKALVYVLGQSECGSGEWDMRIPPTPAGFVIPEIPLGTVATMATMIGAVGLFALRKKYFI